MSLLVGSVVDVSEVHHLQAVCAVGFGGVEGYAGRPGDGKIFAVQFDHATLSSLRGLQVLDDQYQCEGNIPASALRRND